MEPTLIISSVLVLFFFGFDADPFWGTEDVDIFTATGLIDRAGKAVSGTIMIFGLGHFIDVIGDQNGLLRLLPSPLKDFAKAPHDFGGEQLGKQEEEANEHPASIYAPELFESPFKANLSVPTKTDVTLFNSNQMLASPVLAAPLHESSRFDPVNYFMTDNFTIFILCIFLPSIVFFARGHVSRLSQKTPQAGSERSQTASTGGQNGDLECILTRQRNMPEKNIHLSDLEYNVTRNLDRRIGEVHALLEHQVESLDIESLEKKIKNLEEENKGFDYKIRKIKQELVPFNTVAERLQIIQSSITDKVDEKTNSLQKTLNGKIKAFEDQNQKNILQIQKKQTFCDELIEQLNNLEKKVAEYIDGKAGENDDKVRQGVRQRADDVDIGTLDQRLRIVEDEKDGLAKLARQIQEQGPVTDITKKVQDLDRRVFTLLNGYQAELDMYARTIWGFGERINALESGTGWLHAPSQTPPVVDLTDELESLQTKLDERINELNIDSLNGRLRSVESWISNAQSIRDKDKENQIRESDTSIGLLRSRTGQEENQGSQTETTPQKEGQSQTHHEGSKPQEYPQQATEANTPHTYIYQAQIEAGTAQPQEIPSRTKHGGNEPKENPATVRKSSIPLRKLAQKKEQVQEEIVSFELRSYRPPTAEQVAAENERLETFEAVKEGWATVKGSSLTQSRWAQESENQAPTHSSTSSRSESLLDQESAPSQQGAKDEK